MLQSTECYKVQTFTKYKMLQCTKSEMLKSFKCFLMLLECNFMWDKKYQENRNSLPL